MSPDNLKDLNVAIVHYWLVTWRGGEKVIASLLKMFPKADIYTLFYDQTECGKYVKGHQVFSSSLDKPLIRKNYQKLFPLYPYGIKSLKLKKKYDLIISSESGPAKGITIDSPTPHLCYIHTPMRYCWGYMEPYLQSLPAWSRPFARKAFNKLAQWDLTTVDNADLYVANSNNVAKRVERFYKKKAEVCHPPISLDLLNQPLNKQTEKNHYLSFGAITPYKNIDLLVDLFNQTGKPLVVIGEGSEKKKLELKAKSNIRFTGSLPWNEINRLILQSRALIFPGEEDFGIIPLEVMSQGVPVIALKKGGALETVVENRENVETSSGIFFDEPEVESLSKAIDDFERLESQFDPQWIRQQVTRFGEDRFQREMTAYIHRLLEDWKAKVAN